MRPNISSKRCESYSELFIFTWFFTISAVQKNISDSIHWKCNSNCFPQTPAVKALWQNTETKTTLNLLFLVVVMPAPPLTAQGLLRSSLGSFPVCRSLEPSSWELRPSWKKLNMSFYFSTVIMTGATVWGNTTTCDREFFDFSPSWCYSVATIVPFWYKQGKNNNSKVSEVLFFHSCWPKIELYPLENTHGAVQYGCQIYLCTCYNLQLISSFLATRPQEIFVVPVMSSSKGSCVKPDQRCFSWNCC